MTPMQEPMQLNVPKTTGTIKRGVTWWQFPPPGYTVVLSKAAMKIEDAIN